MPDRGGIADAGRCERGRRGAAIIQIDILPEAPNVPNVLAVRRIEAEWRDERASGGAGRQVYGNAGLMKEVDRRRAGGYRLGAHTRGTDRQYQASDHEAEPRSGGAGGVGYMTNVMARGMLEVSRRHGSLRRGGR
ncbi:hypothetical protein A6P55_01270 [Pandoraea pnomenusa]|nr:hypothetical protein A6P55_01270 [Pandoraea pnomenusa]